MQPEPQGTVRVVAMGQFEVYVRGYPPFNLGRRQARELLGPGAMERLDRDGHMPLNHVYGELRRVAKEHAVCGLDDQALALGVQEVVEMWRRRPRAGPRR